MSRKRRFSYCLQTIFRGAIDAQAIDQEAEFLFRACRRTKPYRHRLSDGGCRIVTTASPDESSPSLETDCRLFDRLCDDDKEVADKAAVELLVDQCGRTLQYLARRYAHPELLGELYVHLRENNWRRLRTWGREFPLRHWTRQVAVRLCLANLKSDKKVIRGPAEWSVEELPDRPAPMESPAGHQGTEELLSAIRGLKCERERLVMLSHCLQGRPIAEVAKELQVTVDNAYVIKSRAIDHLRKALHARRSADD